MKQFAILLSAVIWLFLPVQCQKKSNNQYVNQDTLMPQPRDTTPPPPPEYELQDFYSENPSLTAQVEQIASKLSTEEKIAQLVVGLAGELGYPQEKVEELVKNYGIGGIAILKGSKSGIRQEIEQYREMAVQNGHLPLLTSTDAEPYLINRNIAGIPKVPETERITHPAVSQGVAVQIAELLQQMHIRWNYAPVCDFARNRAIINRRSFGNNAAQVAEIASVFAETLQNNGIVATAKHFPGHGMVQGDTHKKLIFLKDSMPELPVFREVVNRGVISVMVGHIAVMNHPRYDTGGKPATLSPVIVNHLLKDSLGFKGIVITDAMNMDAVSGFDRPSLQAFKAGCDMIITPEDVPQFIEQVKTAVAGNPVLKTHLDKAVRKIIRLKICAKLIEP